MPYHCVEPTTTNSTLSVMNESGGIAMEWTRWLKPPFCGKSPRENAIDAMLAQLESGPLTTEQLFNIADPGGRVSAFHELRKDRRIVIVGRRYNGKRISSLWALNKHKD